MNPKKLPYTKFSDRICCVKGCTKKIKENVALRKTRKRLMCYHHYMESIGKARAKQLPPPVPPPLQKPVENGS